MTKAQQKVKHNEVTLLMEGVDRNGGADKSAYGSSARHPPHGGCG